MKSSHLLCLFSALSFGLLIGCAGVTSSPDVGSTSQAISEGKAECHFVAGVNHVALVGQPNMRDMGGFVGQGGKRVLFDKLFRAGDLSQLTTADQQVVNALGIQQLIDLRTAGERQTAPDYLPPGVEAYDIPLIADVGGGSGGMSAFLAAILKGQVKAEDYMLGLYTTIDDLKIAGWTRIFELLENGDTTLFHCTAGKDRAGMTAALVLSALGVDRDTIVADFMASNNYMSKGIEAQIAYINSLYGAGVGELLRPVLGVEEKYIQAFFAAIESSYGSVDQFLDVLKVNRGQLRKNFLECRGATNNDNG